MATTGMKLSPLYVVGIGAGALLVYCSVRDINPLELLKAVLQGNAPPAAGSWSPSNVGTLFAGSGTGAGLELGAQAVGPIGGKWPTSSHRISATFNQPGSMWASGFHDGLDIDGECGDRVWSPTDGKVTSAGYAGAYGNRVIIHSSQMSGVYYWLCHLSSFSTRPGMTVTVGTPIGTMGRTGNTTGCHLHVTVTQNGTKVDPKPYLS